MSVQRRRNHHDSTFSGPPRVWELRAAVSLPQSARLGRAGLGIRKSYRPARPGACSDPKLRSGLDLTADLARLMHGAVHIQIELTRLEARILLVGELRTGRNHPHAFGILRESDNG